MKCVAMSSCCCRDDDFPGILNHVMNCVFGASRRRKNKFAGVARRDLRVSFGESSPFPFPRGVNTCTSSIVTLRLLLGRQQPYHTNLGACLASHAMNIPGTTPPLGGLGGAGNQMQGMNEQEQAMVKMVGSQRLC